MRTVLHISLSIVALLVFSMGACGEKKKKDDDKKEGATETVTSVPEQTVTATATPTNRNLQLQTCYETLNTLVSSGILAVFTQGKTLDVLLDQTIKDDIKKFLEKELGKTFSTLESGAFDIAYGLFKESLKANDCKNVLSGNTAFTNILRTAFGIPLSPTPTPTP